MKVGVYVGSFNPVHKGHILVINYLLNNNYLDKVIIIPTENYWNKNNLIDINKRIDMLKKYETENIIIDTKLNNLEYTYQILNELKKKYKDLYLIIGADNLINFHLWKNIDEILENKVIVVSRNNIDMKKEIMKFNSDNFILINYIGMEISSTKIRELINKNNIKELDTYLDQEIIDYILKNNLYKEES